ncbi:MAG: acetylornithine transaminase [Methanothrix sp.]|jgi:acetylornithine/N-succinyldiaminopimelate aminotransferase|uniref:Acetylornithine aminotransferase n=1 Tax=Methanothrix thermoacetophila (strain DSM 6194 / JCM 14653 / NBRC 101360 / PT) TaxID=349307 RepID=A0B5Y4_METTP|nr:MULTISPECIES: acetylornithine transaminase [Methanothrix]ABK14108.1 acetylornithine aminotransferase apoenzyme [Methanothrix thermoacetophila PT]MBC7079787.1 acetylornithine transaminase [Methanothrix sp.]NPU87864.1 acetylornithine transaminase [Methanothrix sp.]
MSIDDIIKRESRAIFQTYTRQPVLIARGSGARVWDQDGREYIDFVAGIAVNNVGHCHPRVVEAIKRQCELLIHTSNLYYTENQVRLAEELKSLSGMDKVFFCNSGTESVEAALKLTRRATGRIEIVAATGSFHGRTLGALGLTYKQSYREPFRPLNEATFVPYNDLEALKSAVTKETAAVILEPVQGEAGVYPASNEYLRAAREICDDRGALLIFDEVQTGFGRTGRWFAKEHSGVMPDIMTLAKAIAGGLPMGAMLSNENISGCFQRGDHASTFGGGPLVCAAALASISAIRDENLVRRSEEMGSYLLRELSRLPVSARGLGLMVGVDIDKDARAVVDAARADGVLLNSTGEHTLRLVPPLVVTKEEIDRVVDVIGERL